jgi:hypothetical protein
VEDWQLVYVIEWAISEGGHHQDDFQRGRRSKTLPRKHLPGESGVPIAVQYEGGSEKETPSQDAAKEVPIRWTY